MLQKLDVSYDPDTNEVEAKLNMSLYGVGCCIQALGVLAQQLRDQMFAESEVDDKEDGDVQQ